MYSIFMAFISPELGNHLATLHGIPIIPDFSLGDPNFVVPVIVIGTVLAIGINVLNHILESKGTRDHRIKSPDYPTTKSPIYPPNQKGPRR